MSPKKWKRNVKIKMLNESIRKIGKRNIGDQKKNRGKGKVGE